MLATKNRPQLLRIGDVARLSGKSVRAIHLYEELGLLQPTTRSTGGFRLFESSVVERVRWIDLLHGLGFSLQEMRAVVEKWWGAQRGPEAMNELRALFERKLGETRQAIQRHEQLERELLEGLRYLQVCRECGTEAPAQACVACSRDHGEGDRPMLVAGLQSVPEVGARRRAARPAFVRLEDLE